MITEDSIIKDIPKNKHSEFLEELMKHYIDKQGLGGIPKTDFDALLVYLYTKYSGKAFDVFSLSQRFMVKEARIKSLYETGLIKYSHFWGCFRRPIFESQIFKKKFRCNLPGGPIRLRPLHCHGFAA